MAKAIELPEVPKNGSTMIDWSRLREPFPIEMLKLRVGRTNGYGKKGQKDFRVPTKAWILTYIDARAVEDRLDEVMGPENWKDTFRWLDNGKGVECTLSLWNGHCWIEKTDAADWTRIESTKGGYSDALKRAAAKHGIGRELYDLPMVQVPCNEYSKFNYQAAFNQIFANFEYKEREIHYGDYLILQPVSEDVDAAILRKQDEQAEQQGKSAGKISVFFADTSDDKLPHQPHELDAFLNAHYLTVFPAGGDAEEQVLFHSIAEIAAIMGKWPKEPGKGKEREVELVALRNYLAIAFSLGRAVKENALDISSINDAMRTATAKELGLTARKVTN